jgi:class 3 adenylate cyclase
MVDATPLVEPRVERFPAAVLFADISGFTQLTEQLSQLGPAGAEELSGLLNTYYSQLIGIITQQGGDVVKFAGDALLVVWPTQLEADLATVTLKAAQCGLAIQTGLDNYETDRGHKLSLRVSVGAGEVIASYLGGVSPVKNIRGRWELVVLGQPLIQMSHDVKQAQPGQVVVSPQAWQLIENSCKGNKLSTGSVHLEKVEQPIRIEPLDRPVLSSETQRALLSYIPGAVLPRLNAGQTAWLAELRKVTIIFLNLPDFNHNTPLDQAQMVMRALQDRVYRYEGSINKLNVDDKGVTLVAALGLPPLAHEDDAVRGVGAAWALKMSLAELQVRCFIGVTTGLAFCGEIGGSQRQEYTMMGDRVNLAARLMQAAEQRNDDSILCDSNTFQNAQASVIFEALPAVTVKGKAEPISIYRPVGQIKKATRSKIAIVGRETERKFLEAELDALQHDGTGSIVLIEGEPGIGKSRIIDEFRHLADLKRITAFVGGGIGLKNLLFIMRGALFSVSFST